jgi:hypothetical protein
MASLITVYFVTSLEAYYIALESVTYKAPVLAGNQEPSRITRQLVALVRSSIVVLCDRMTGNPVGHSIGYINGKLPAAPTSAFHDVTVGNNAFNGPGETERKAS